MTQSRATPTWIRRTYGLVTASVLLCSLTGCWGNSASDSPSPQAPAPASSAPVAAAPSPKVTPTPPPSAAASAPASPSDSDMQAMVKDYNGQVNAQNQQAKDVIQGYTDRIKSATGQ